MKLALTITEAIECFGDETIARWIERGMNMDHRIAIYRAWRNAVSEVEKEGTPTFAPLHVPREWNLNVMVVPNRPFKILDSSLLVPDIPDSIFYTNTNLSFTALVDG